jgi:hypothetical protein
LFSCDKSCKKAISLTVLEGPEICEMSKLTNRGEVVSLMSKPLFIPRKIPGRPQEHSEAGRILGMSLSCILNMNKKYVIETFKILLIFPIKFIVFSL